MPKAPEPPNEPSGGDRLACTEFEADWADRHRLAGAVETLTREVELLRIAVTSKMPRKDQADGGALLPRRYLRHGSTGTPSFASFDIACTDRMTDSVLASSEAKEEGLAESAYSFRAAGAAAAQPRVAACASGIGKVATEPSNSFARPATPPVFEMAASRKASGVLSAEFWAQRGSLDAMPDDRFMEQLMHGVSGSLGPTTSRKRTRFQQLLEIGEEPPRTSMLARCWKSPAYEKFVGLVIMLNILFAGIRVDYAVEHQERQVTPMLLFIDSAFLLYFMCDLLISLAVHRIYFFVGPKWPYNLLEVIIIVVSAVNMAFELATASKGSGFRADQIRLARIFQVSKILRAIRGVALFHELRVLIRSFKSGLRSLAWSLMVLLVFFYVFSIFFVGAAADVNASAHVDGDTRRLLMEAFGSTGASLLSLFTATLGGKDWEELARPLRKAGAVYYFLFIGAICFMMLALLNVLTGLFVERAVSIDPDDYRGYTMVEAKRERHLVKEFARVFCAILLRSEREDPASLASGPLTEKHITEADFEDYMHNVPDARHLLAVLGLRIWDTNFFFRFFLRNCPDGQVDVNNFVDVCMQMRGPATCFDLQVALELVTPAAMRDPYSPGGVAC